MMNKIVKRRTFLGRSAGAAGDLLVLPPFLTAGRQRRSLPSIILIMCDAAGHADSSFQVSRQFLPLHIDSLARNGVRFAPGNMSAAGCAPAKTGLLFGRYQINCRLRRQSPWQILAGVTDVAIPKGQSLGGDSLPPYVKGRDQTRPLDTLFWRRGYDAAESLSEWKLHQLPHRAPGLMNLARDASEQHDFACQFPVKVTDL